MHRNDCTNRQASVDIYDWPSVHEHKLRLQEACRDKDCLKNGWATGGFLGRAPRPAWLVIAESSSHGQRGRKLGKPRKHRHTVRSAHP